MKDYQDILISINPEFVEKILSGEKRVEYRKTLANIYPNKSKMLIYETSPVKKVVGSAKITATIIGNKEIVWLQTQKYAGIEKSFFDQYFAKQENACCYVLAEVERFTEPLNLSDFGIKQAPQNFCYLKEF